MSAETPAWEFLLSNNIQSSQEATDVGTKLARMITSSSLGNDTPTLESVAIHILNEAIDSPVKIDVLLSIYVAMANALPDDFTDATRFRGRDTARKALGIKLSNCTQSLNPVLRPIFVDLLDDTCQNIPHDSNPTDVAEAVLKMAEYRRIYIMAAAMYGRARVMDAVMEDDPAYDMAIYRIEDSLGLSTDAVVQTESNHVAAGKVFLE